MMITFFQHRMVFSHQIHFRKSGKNHKSYYSSIQQQHAYFHESNPTVMTEHSRLYHQSNIQPMTEDNDRTNHFQEDGVPLRVPRHQHKKRQRKVQYQIQIEEQTVGFAVKSFHVIHGFFWNVCVVNQQELREPQVSPEDRECKYIFTHIMDMVGVHHR